MEVIGWDWIGLHCTGPGRTIIGLGSAWLVWVSLYVFPLPSSLPFSAVSSTALREGGVVGAAGGLALDRAVPPPSGAPGRARAGGGGGGAGQRTEKKVEREGGIERERERERERESERERDIERHIYIYIYIKSVAN